MANQTEDDLKRIVEDAVLDVLKPIAAYISSHVISNLRRELAEQPYRGGTDAEDA